MRYWPVGHRMFAQAVHWKPLLRKRHSPVRYIGSPLAESPQVLLAQARHSRLFSGGTEQLPVW